MKTPFLLFWQYIEQSLQNLMHLAESPPAVSKNNLTKKILYHFLCSQLKRPKKFINKYCKFFMSNHFSVLVEFLVKTTPTSILLIHWEFTVFSSQLNDFAKIGHVFWIWNNHIKKENCVNVKKLEKYSRNTSSFKFSDFLTLKE